MEEYVSNILGGQGKCPKCGEVVGNVAYHQSFCDKEKIIKEAIISKQLDLSLSFKSDSQKIKEIEEENKKLKETVRILSERLTNTSRRLNKIIDESYNDIISDRDDYR